MSRRAGAHNKGTPARSGVTPQADVDWAVGSYYRWKAATADKDAVAQAEALVELDDLMAHLAGHSAIYGPLLAERPRCANQPQEATT